MNHATTKLEQYRKDRSNIYGFCPDPDAPLWKNKQDYFDQLSLEEFEALPTNMAMHNYCEKIQPPVGSRRLLGLGLKFCIRNKRPTNNVNSSLNRFENDVRRIKTFLHHPDDNNYIPGLYIKSDFLFKRADNATEAALSNFRDAVINTRRPYCRPRRTNLTSIQWEVLKVLKNNDHFIAIEADKNLGGCLLERPHYNVRGVREHLGNTNVYQRLTKQQITGKMCQLQFKYKAFVRKYEYVLLDAEITFLERALKKYPPMKLARFRMSLKAHKGKNWKMRPIVCCAGTFMNALSKWLDNRLSQLKRFIPSYMKDSNDLLLRLKDMGRLPPHARLFTMDAVSMYSNINTEHAIEVISAWLDNLDLEGNGIFNYPLAAVKEAMKLVMENNYFEWGDLYFHQLTGTAMGTSAAVMWATIYFAIREEYLLHKYGNDLLLYKRFIDDGIGAWIGPDYRWIEFQADVNDFGDLKWEVNPLSSSVDFMDLTISINSSLYIQTKTYQKPMNLYQYIPPTSAHPRNMMKGIVYGLLRQYKRQNTLNSDYINQAKLLFKRHVARGWNKADMKQYILDADAKLSATTQLQSTATERTTPPNNKSRVFLHWQYHPNDIPRNVLRSLYDKYCKEHFEKLLGITQFTIAYSRPPNIRSEVTKAKLHQAPGEEASKYYEGELTFP